MLRLDLVYCISFSICPHAGRRLIVWRFLLVKAFKHSNSWLCFLHSVRGLFQIWNEMTLCILLFHGCTDKAFGCRLAGLKAPCWPREDISPAIGFDNCRSSHCSGLLIGSEWGDGRESQAVGLQGGRRVVQDGVWRERVLCFLWALSNILWWQGPFLTSKSWTIFGQK